MSLIVQLGTTSVGYTPNISSAVMSSTNNQPSNVAKHRLPMQINRQPQHVNRTIITQTHSNLPVRNIAALARPLCLTLSQPLLKPTKQQPQQKKQPTVTPPTSSSVAGRVLTSPAKDPTLDDDLLEGVVEKRPKFHKHLPLNYQYVLQDHNYGAPPPHSPPPSPLVNGLITQNGITRNQPYLTHQSPAYLQQNFTANRTGGISNVFGIGTREIPGDESDVDSSEGEREVDPQGEETETAPEGEGDDEDSITRCVCEFQHDDGYMICCDKCLVWQHVDCMGIDRTNIPDEYLCETCQPRRIDKQRAIALQLRKRQEFMDTSDSSSDTSSSSDSNLPTNTPVRKQSLSVANRRRSEPVQRKTSINNNNNNSNVKQRRESTKETQFSSQSTGRQNNRQIVRKKQVEKRPSIRRKSIQSPLNMHDKTANEKKTSSPISTTDNNSSSVQQLRQWIDSYEEAVTNHYSPELRARIANIKVNGINSDFKLPTNLLTTQKCRVSLLPTGVKILVSSVSLPSNQPVLELRGKYMLCGTGSLTRPPRPAVPLPGPHIFHYRLSKDNTEVCVDTRTYGNDARFVRRSCKPNAEIRHCVEKGTLHLYLVTTKQIEKNTEITLAHETPGISLCACGESACSTSTKLSAAIVREEIKTHNGTIQQVSSISSAMIPLINNSEHNEQPMDKRRRGRRRTVSESNNCPKPSPKSIPKSTSKLFLPLKTVVSKTISSKASPTNSVTPLIPTPASPYLELEHKASLPSPPLAPTTRSSSNGNFRKTFNLPLKKETIDVTVTTSKAKKETSEKKKKMTREERKMEAIMKAFERMEKDQARKQEVQARQAQRKDSSESDVKLIQAESTEDKKVPVEKENTSVSNNRPLSKKKKFASSKRKGRAKSQNIYHTTLRPRRILRHNSKMQTQSRGAKTSSDEEEITSSVIIHSTPPHEAITPTPSPSPPLLQEDSPTAGLLMEISNQNKYTREDKSPPYDSTLNSGHSTSSSDTPPTPMSKTAMLVAAAVGPLAPGFKFPKTKKGMLSTWFKSPENSPPAPPLCSPPIADDSPTQPGPGFAKKRWLRQAISEECDSRPDMAVSPTDYVAPLKKRRLARESMSSEQPFTPPSTPTHNKDGSIQDPDDIEPAIGPKTPPFEAQINSCIENKDPDCEDEDEECDESEDDEIIKKDCVAETAQNLREERIPESMSIKRKLSISEYRQRKQGNRNDLDDGDQTGEGEGDCGQPTSPTTSTTSSISSSSSDEADTEIAAIPEIITKSLLLEAALDSKLLKSGSPLSRFSSAPTSVERQRENLTQRLKREFGLFLSDDEEQEKRRGMNCKEKEKDTGNKKKLPPPPPPPPPLEPPSLHYPHLYYSTAAQPGGTVYVNHFSTGQIPPPSLIEPSYFNSTSNLNTFYNQLPH